MHIKIRLIDYTMKFKSKTGDPHVFKNTANTYIILVYFDDKSSIRVWVAYFTYDR